MFNICTTGDTVHIDTIFNFLPHIAAMKNIDALMLTRVWQELEYHIDVCRVTRDAHIEHL
jgi:hypothetical protein